MKLGILAAERQAGCKPAETEDKVEMHLSVTKAHQADALAPQAEPYHVEPAHASELGSGQAGGKARRNCRTDARASRCCMPVKSAHYALHKLSQISYT